MENFHFPPAALGGYGTNPYGSVPGSRKLFVRSTPQDLSPIPDHHRFTTLAGALAHCRAGAGDEIHILPGHSESVTSATALSGLVAGTRIFGHGPEGYKPEFRWTATTANWALNVAGVEICGLRLRVEGANGVDSAITVTGADCCIRDCDIEATSGASNLADIVCTVGAGANRFRFLNNRVRGTTNAGTNVILVSGAAADVTIRGNQMITSCSTTEGLIRITAAALRMLISNNLLFNTTAAAETCISSSAVAATGVAEYNRLGTSAGVPVSDTLELNAATLFRMFENYGTDTANTSGLLAPAVVT